MKTRLLLLAGFFAALLTGCATADKFNALHVGMTEDEVVSAIGKPDSKSAQANIEYFTYYLANDSGRPFDQPYSVRFVDGKLESFGRFAQLLDLYNRPVAGTPQAGVGYAAPGYAAPYSTTRVITSGPDIATEIQKLKTLKDQGALTDAEFQAAKEKLLGTQGAQASH